MKLQTWLTQAEISRANFADKISTSIATIGRYINGERKPTDGIYLKIHAATNGQVTPNDFYDLPEIPENTETD
ncbi:MAG: helix-turn-helix transcriptional regulator [Hyphomicrobiales bacterium]